jgi:hypothetical protein
MFERNSSARIPMGIRMSRSLIAWLFCATLLLFSGVTPEPADAGYYGRGYARGYYRGATHGYYRGAGYGWRGGYYRGYARRGLSRVL